MHAGVWLWQRRRLASETSQMGSPANDKRLRSQNYYFRSSLKTDNYLA